MAKTGGAFRPNRADDNGVSILREIVAHIGGSERTATVKEVINKEHLTGLVCDCDHAVMKDGFCGHIADVIKQNLDVPVISAVCDVPMWDKPRFNVTVVIEPPGGDDSPMSKCGIALFPQDSDSEDIQAEFIGFILPEAQGRKYLRVMINDWLTELAVGTEPACRAPHHTDFTFFAESKSKPGLTARRHLRDLYYIHTTGWCWFCHETDGIPDV